MARGLEDIAAKKSYIFSFDDTPDVTPRDIDVCGVIRRTVLSISKGYEELPYSQERTC